MKINKTINEPIRAELDRNIAWSSEDKGLIAAWEAGRKIRARRDSDSDSACLVEAIERGELPVLPFKGGVSKPLKSGKKIGVHLYLAMLLGIKGEDLDVDTDVRSTLRCRKTDVVVTFTSDFEDYKNAE